MKNVILYAIQLHQKNTIPKHTPPDYKEVLHFCDKVLGIQTEEIRDVDAFLKCIDPALLNRLLREADRNEVAK